MICFCEIYYFGKEELFHNILVIIFCDVKVTFKRKEFLKYQFNNVEKIQRGDDTPERNKDDKNWKRSRRIMKTFFFYP